MSADGLVEAAGDLLVEALADVDALPEGLPVATGDVLADPLAEATGDVLPEALAVATAEVLGDPLAEATEAGRWHLTANGAFEKPFYAATGGSS